MNGWPVDYHEQLSGAACSLCAEGRPDVSGARLRFFSSAVSDGYLHRGGVQRGYVVVIWRGRHVVDPTELAADEAMALWADVMQVSRAMQRVYRPLKMNYQMLGNRIAHLHWIIAPRFVDDVAPGDPLPGSGYHDFPEHEVLQEVAQLRAVLAQTDA